MRSDQEERGRGPDQLTHWSTQSRNGRGSAMLDQSDTIDEAQCSTAPTWVSLRRLRRRVEGESKMGGPRLYEEDRRQRGRERGNTKDAER